MTVEELQVLITANSDSLRKEIQESNKKIAGLQKQVTKTSNSIFSAVLKGNIVTKVLSKGISLIGQNLDNAVTRLDALNNFPKVMSNLGISAKDANDAMSRLSDGLIGLPTTLDSATMSVQRFTSANGNVKASTEMFLALNNAILSGGADMNIQKSALEQLSQAYAKGKPDMMEWRSAMTAMPAQLKQVAIAMGYVSADQLGEALRNGKVSMDEFMSKIVELNHNGVNGFKSFEEQARNSTGGVATSITNVKTAFTRGLAEIMNAIGQSNIAGFFQGIARAINQVIPYVTAFVKVVVTGINYINSLFGGTNKTTQAISKTSSSLNNLGTSGKASSKGLDKATGSAKKLKKELNGLAGFDEMNVLQESNDTSGGSSDSGDSGSTGISDLGSIDLSGFDSAVSNSNSKVDELYKKMLGVAKWFTSDMNFQPLIDSFYELGDSISYLCSGAGSLLGDYISNYIKPLSTYVINEALPHFFTSTSDAIKGINFDKVSNALNKLWKALEPFQENIGNGLLWIYDHAILPISKVTINNILPGFLTTFAGAINILNTAINEVKPVFEWLWSSFLEPILSWTGGVIEDVLTAIGDALSWIAQNEVAVAILEGIAIALGIVALGMNAINIAMGIYNVAMVVCNTVTGIFAGIMAVLTSPITLVVLAIGALVAVVILLVKHWEEVKEIAIKVWDKIKEIWGTVATWFNEHVIQPIKDFLSPIVDFFKDIFTTAIDNVKIIFENLIIIAQFVWEGIKTVFSIIGEWFKEKWNNAVSIIKAVFTPIKDFFSGVWSSIKNIFNVVGTFFKDVFTKAFNAVKSVFTPIVSFFSGIFDKIKGIFKKIGTTVGQVISGAFKGVVNGVLSTIENVLNSPIKAINGLIKTINKVPGINLGTLKTFNLPRLARGGIVDKPTIAQIGENGKEAIMPLERNTSWIDNLAEKLKDKTGGSDRPIKLIVKLGEDTIYDKFIEYVGNKEFETNGEVFNI